MTSLSHARCAFSCLATHDGAGAEAEDAKDAEDAEEAEDAEDAEDAVAADPPREKKSPPRANLVSRRAPSVGFASLSVLPTGAIASGG